LLYRYCLNEKITPNFVAALTQKPPNFGKFPGSIFL
jgi:hypothetical protein